MACEDLRFTDESLMILGLGPPDKLTSCGKRAMPPFEVVPSDPDMLNNVCCLFTCQFRLVLACSWDEGAMKVNALSPEMHGKDSINPRDSPFFKSVYQK